MTRLSLSQKSSSVSWSNFLTTRMGKFSNSVRRSLPFLVGGALAATLFLWQALIAQERAYIEQETQLEAASVKNELTALMESRIQVLVRMSERWERRGKTPKNEWEFEAGLNLRDFKGFQAIEWVDPSFHLRWLVPLEGNKASQTKDLSRIDFAEYIRNLVANLFCSYELRANTIALKINVDNVLLDINAAIPCGLIINELVANSLKYAFSAGKEGELCIEFSSDKDSNFILIVSDDGVGFPKDLDFQNTKSLGLQLVNALTEQLEGTIELHNHIGTKFIITFTRKIYREIE